MRRKLLIAVAVFTLSLSNLGLTSWHDRELPTESRAATPAGVLLELLGEIRTFMARTLWFKADIYHHAMEAQGIPWTAETDLMSLYRMITLLDPRLVEAYDVGAYQLVMHFHREAEGFQFLEEGLSANPDSYELQQEMAFLLYEKKRYKEAVQHADVALQLAVKRFQELSTMTAEEQATEKMGREIDVINSLRVLAHAYRDVGMPKAEEHYLRLWQRIRPDDDYVKRRLKELGV